MSLILNVCGRVCGGREVGGGGRKYSPCGALLTPAIPQHCNYSFYIRFSQRDWGGKRKSGLLQERQQPNILSVKLCGTAVDSLTRLPQQEQKRLQGGTFQSWQYRGRVAS